MPHTPEPCARCDYFRTVPFPDAPEGSAAMLAHDAAAPAGTCSRCARETRVEACVNACAGITDPADAIKELAQRAREALAALETPGDLTEDDRAALVEDLTAAIDPFGHDWT